MGELWARIEASLQRNAPDTLSTLEPGATDSQIAEADQALAVSPPQEVHESYRIHNGMRGGAGGLVNWWLLLPLAAIVSEWSVLKQLWDDGTFEGMEGDAAVQIKPMWWNPRWIPFLSNSSGDFYCIDLDPEPTGSHGQIISFFHSEPRRELIAPDFRSWLEGVATTLERAR